MIEMTRGQMTILFAALFDAQSHMLATEGLELAFASIHRFGTVFGNGTTRSAVHLSTAGFLDPVLNDNPVAVETHEVLPARRFVNPR